MNSTNLRYSILIVAIGLLVITQAHARTPVWTYSAPIPATMTISPGGIDTIQYTITNHSNHSKNLILSPTPGLSASPCYLATIGSTCTLTLTVNGSAIPAKGIQTGPVLCEQGNPNQCDSPSKENELNIILVPTPAITNYLGLYVETHNSLVTYSPNNGASWGYMLNAQGGHANTWATTVTSDGTMYQATGVPNSAATIIYSSDGITWAQVASFPVNNTYVQSMFAMGKTLYVGTGDGHVYSTSNKGVTWRPGTPAQVPDGGSVNAIMIDDSGHYFAGTSNGTIYYSSNLGESWTALPNQPATGGGAILSLAMDTRDTLYAVTSATTTQPQYNTAPLTTGTWQTMTALPGTDGNATTIAAVGTVVYVGTNSGYVVYTSNKGVSWSANQVPNDTSGITSLFVNKTTSLSPLFVESYGMVQLGGSSSTGSITVTNFSSTRVSNVRANASQLPAGVTSSSCASVVAGGSCTITLTAAGGASAFAPTTFDIIDSSNHVISRAALVSSITRDGGANYYYVYNVNGSTSYVLDNTNASNGIIWSSNGSGTYDGGIAIFGISESSTIASPNPSSGQVTGQTACKGAIDGSCDSNNIQVKYSAIPTGFYAEGLCYQSTNGGASAGEWYLPSTCELNGGIYLTANNFSSCAPALTGLASIYHLGALGGVLQGVLSAGFYWSSTEAAFAPQTFAWYQAFNPGGGNVQPETLKSSSFGVRCVRGMQ